MTGTAFKKHAATPARTLQGGPLSGNKPKEADTADNAIALAAALGLLSFNFT